MTQTYKQNQHEAATPLDVINEATTKEKGNPFL